MRASLVLTQTRVRRAVALAAAAIALLAGCSSLTPCNHRDLQGKFGLACAIVGYRDQPDSSERGCLLGSVAAEPSDAPIVVFIYQQRGAHASVIESAVLPHPGPYSFAVPPGAYRVAAFVDVNGDLRYDPEHEPGGVYNGGHTVAVMPGQRVDRLDLQLRPDKSQRIGFKFSVPESGDAAPGDASSDRQCVTASASR
jgi:hypothetical protein